MGQYYKIAFKNEATGKITFSDRNVAGQRVMAKLLEHSNHGCILMHSVVDLLSKGKYRFAWVGDYAEPDEISESTRGEVRWEDFWFFDEKTKYNEAKELDFSFVPAKPYGNKFLVNWDKGLYIPLRGGFFRENISWTSNGKTVKYSMHFNPIPILTAIGNGRGGGDYFQKGEELAGTWTWDLLSVEDAPPEGFKKLRHAKKTGKKAETIAA